MRLIMNNIIDVEAQEQEREMLKEKLETLFRDILKIAQEEVNNRISWYKRRFKTEDEAIQSLVDEFQPKLMNDEFATQIVVEYDFPKNSTADDYINYLVPFFVNYICLLVPAGQDDEYIKSTAEVLMAYWVVKKLHNHEESVDASNSASDEELTPTPESLKDRVEKTLSFMSRRDVRQAAHILSEKDFRNLVDWVTYYFEHDFKIPDIQKPIQYVHTSKGNVFNAFKVLFNNEHPRMSLPDSLFELIKACFHPYREDAIDNMRKTKKSTDFDKLFQ